MTARKKVVQGATSSGKTYGIVPILYDRCLATPNLKVTIVAESIPAVKDGAVDIFQTFMMDTNRWVDARWLGNPMQYKLPNRSRIQFKSFDTVGKAKAAGKRDILFINEANSIPFNIADALMIRSKEVWLDFNADNEFWAHTEILTEPNSEFLKLTYLDNELIPEETLEDLMIKRSKAYFDPEGDLKNPDNIKSKYWHNWWKVYGLGETGRLQGSVYENWEILDELPVEAKIQGLGGDFGWVHPQAAVAVYEWNGRRVYDEVSYGSYKGTKIMAQDIKARGLENETAYFDNSAPQLISELVDEGINAHPCDGKTGLINFAVEKMNQETFYVTKRSVNIIAELHGYVWDTDSKGKPTGKPIKVGDDAMNAIQYFEATEGKYSGNYR